MHTLPPTPDHPRVTRRKFLSLGACVAASACIDAHAQGDTSKTSTHFSGTLHIDENTPLHTIPQDYTGLSYESAQLANPDFFSASNHGLIHLFRELNPQGVLRLGGGTSNYTTYSAKPPSGPPPFVVFGPDTSKTAKKGTITSELAIRNLRSFLDATNWTCLYGLNLGRGTVHNAVAEAEAVHRILGPRLMAFQIGNEPDTYNHFRPHGYNPHDFVHEWITFRDAIVPHVPTARFAGPDISNNLSYLTAFADIAPRYRDIILLTIHYYAMGPAGNPAATLHNLLSPQPKLTTLKWKNLPIIFDAMRKANLPCRISEVNSCWNGGEPGASNVFGSALWCCDMMLHFASLGFSGVNLHGGGYGIYSPIVGSPSSGFTRRPEYFGMLFAQHLSGATILKSHLLCDSDRITAYAARMGRRDKRMRLLALINKTNTPTHLQLKGKWAKVRHWRATELSAPSLTATSNITLRKIGVSFDDRITLPSHSALLLTSDIN